jgi:crotonobetaine/carnitine-CoA ligase
VIVGDPWQPQPPGSVGRPSPAYDVHIVDDDGAPLQGRGTGHLLVGGVRGLSLFKEYMDNPQATAEAFDAQGRFRTGDRVTVDGEGFLHFADRARDMIKVGGESVSPAEIESVLTGLPFVRDAAVVGRSDATRGEVPIAFLVLDPAQQGQPQDALGAQAIEACREALARFKVPREVIFVHELPRINFGKVNKVRLRELAALAPAAFPPQETAP